MFIAYSRITTTVLLITFVTACQNQVDSSGFPPPAPINHPQAMVGNDKNQAFAPGDFMELIVEEDKGLNGRYLIRPGGYAIMPRLGRVQIGGMSSSAAEVKMKKLLEANQLIEATVMVERWPGNIEENSANGITGQQESITVLLTGRVSRPGMHKIPVYDGENPGVYSAILSAGGLAEFSKSSKVTIRRKDGSGKLHLIPVRLDLIEKGEIPDVPIGSNDVIDVGEKVFGF